MTVARRRTPPTAQPIEDHDAPRVHAPSGRFQVRRGAAGAAFPALRRRSKAAPKAERNHFRQRRKWIATKSRGGNKALVPRLLWGSQRASCQRCRRRGKVMLRKGPSRELCLASAVSCAQQPRDARRPPASTASPRNATQSDTPRNDHSSCIQGASVVSGTIRGGWAGGSPPAPGRLGSSRAGCRRSPPAPGHKTAERKCGEGRGARHPRRCAPARPPSLTRSFSLGQPGPAGSCACVPVCVSAPKRICVRFDNTKTMEEGERNWGTRVLGPVPGTAQAGCTHRPPRPQASSFVWRCDFSWAGGFTSWRLAAGRPAGTHEKEDEQQRWRIRPSRAGWIRPAGRSSQPCTACGRPASESAGPGPARPVPRG